MAYSFLKDAQGNKSSKRLCGVILLGLAVVFAVILFIYSILNIKSDTATAISIINMLLLAGSSLCGVGTFEKLINITKK
tara:strand:- start:223 stop:459 length:237 start_codon:yes stop_codon:yes gene_type:complete